MQFKQKTISLLRLISIIEDDSSPDCQLLRNHFYLFFFSDIRENQAIAMNYAPKLVPIPKTLIRFTTKFFIVYHKLQQKLYLCHDIEIEMSREERNTVGYVVALISEFAACFGIQPRQAYAYLKRFKGLQHLERHYGVLHTQSFPDAIETMVEVCAHNGGQLR